MRVVPSTSSLSALRGSWFVFDHAHRRFGLWVSSLTGKEEVYLDGRLVAQRRKFAFTSIHQVQARGTTFTLELTTKNLWRGAYQCVLYENGTRVAGLETEYLFRSRAWKHAVVAAAAGAIFAAHDLSPPRWTATAALAIVAALLWIWSGRGRGFIIRPMAIEPVRHTDRW